MHLIYKKWSSFQKNFKFTENASNIASKIASLMSYGPLDRSDRSEIPIRIRFSRPELVKLRPDEFLMKYFSKIVEKLAFQGYIPLSLIPLGGPYGQREGDTRKD